MNRTETIVLLEGVPVGDDPDRAGFLVRQVVMEAGRIVASGRLPLLIDKIRLIHGSKGNCYRVWPPLHGRCCPW